MIRVMLIGIENPEFTTLLEKMEGVQVQSVNTGEEAIQITNHGGAHLALVWKEIDGLDAFKFSEQLVAANPFMNLAIVGSLSEADFHEASEGLGVLKQINESPTYSEMDELLVALKRVMGLAQ